MQNEPLIFRISRPLYKSLISMIFAGLIIFITNQILPGDKKDPLIFISIGWIGFAISYLFISWLLFFKSNAKQVNNLADKEDGSLAFVFAMVLVASLSSFVTVLILVIENKKMEMNQDC